MNIVYIKIRGKEEIAFPECFYEQHNNFVIIHTTDHPEHEIGAFNISVVEYVYNYYEDNKRDAREWFERGVKINGWVDEIKSGKPTE